MDLVELIIDENKEKDGVFAISFVEEPAIEENWVALSQQKYEFKSIDEEQKVIVGFALVPDKQIFRKQGDREYNIVFSKETVKQASHLYLKQLNNKNTTLDHSVDTDGVTVVESWIVEDVKNDKSQLYGLNAIEGAWCVVMKVDNDKVWKDVKDGVYMGLSIEGIFSPKEVKEELSTLDLSNIDSLTEEQAYDLIDKLKEIVQ